MKNITASVFAASFALCACAAPTGTWNSWLGWNVGTNATASFSQLVGAEAGANSSDVLASAFCGVRSGAECDSVTSAFALGAMSLYGAKCVTDVLAAGYGAGCGATNIADCVFVGRGAGYGANNVTGRVDICGLVYADKASGVTRIGSGDGEIACSNRTLRVAGSVASIGFATNRIDSGNLPVGWVQVSTPYYKIYDSARRGVETSTSRFLADGSDFVTKKVLGSYVALDKTYESHDETDTDEETGEVYTNTVETVVDGVMTLKAPPTSEWQGSPACNKIAIVSRDYVDRGDAVKIVGSYDAETNCAILGSGTNATRTLTFAAGASSGLKITVTGGGDAVTVTIGE